MKAVDMASKQRKAADDFTATFPSSTVKKWKRMVRKWEADSSRPNPYVSKERGRCYVISSYVPRLTVISSASKLSEIRLRLVQEEAAEAERGQRTPHQVSASVFVRMGLDLEDQQ